MAYKLGRKEYMRQYRIKNSVKLNAANKKYWEIWRKDGSLTKRYKHYNLKSKYGITLEEYDEMLKAQNDVCAICKNKKRMLLTSKGTLYVDHNHTTGKVRGLLCGSCNSALGYVEDNIDIMKSMIEYIIKWK